MRYEHTVYSSLANGAAKQTGQFKVLWQKLGLLHPALEIEVVYGNTASTVQTSPILDSEVVRLERMIADRLTGSTFHLRLLDSSAILARLNQRVSYKARLRATETLTHEAEDGASSYACLVLLRDYVDFIVDENGEYREHLFEGNVRHHEGSSSAVNVEIAGALSDQSAPDF